MANPRRLLSKGRYLEIQIIIRVTFMKILLIFRVTLKELRFKNLIIGYWQCLYYWQDIRLSEKNLCVKAPTIST